MSESLAPTRTPAFEALRMPDGSEREAAIDSLGRQVRAVSDTNHVPRIVERGLTAIAIRIAREVVRRGAPAQGFTPDELEREFVAFAEALQTRLNA